MPKSTVCPFMSGPAPFTESADSYTESSIVFQDCLQHQCELWITVYTTELRQVSGCAKALAPQMVDGQVRV